jgi:hypothetical protein
MTARDDYPYTDQGLNYLTVSKERYEAMLAEIDRLRAVRDNADALGIDLPPIDGSET